ncbi:MAG TPA: GNAT family N-acetyltransferase, partial [Candidatus Thermoplasmatota archaeon]|nr:GNAT family N-acetyltransferase [Candidatus Thermoplasmatota archaeon]
PREAAEALVAWTGDAPVGLATVAVYEGADGAPALAWVGGPAVLPAWRGRGAGRALLDAALARAAGAPVVGLDATPEVERLCAKAGFRAASRATRWRRAAGAPRPAPGGRHSVHPISLSEAMEIAEYDLPRFGAKRLRALLAVLHGFPWTAFMARDRRTGDVTGFGLGHERAIGPLVADDDGAAAALLAACEMAGAPPTLLAPDDHAGARRVLEAAGWTPEGPATTRMLRSGGLPGRPEAVYGLAAWGLG